MKKEKEKEFYDVIKNWDFSKFEIETELLTNWDLYEILFTIFSLGTYFWSTFIAENALRKHYNLTIVR